MDSKTWGALCLKYSNHPFNVRFRSAQMAFILRPLLRRVLLRIASLSLLRLFLRGHFFPLSKWYPRKSNPPLSLASTSRVLVGCNFSPFSSTHWLICSNAFCASSWLEHRTTKSSAYLTISQPFRVLFQSSPLRSIFDKRAL